VEPLRLAPVVLGPAPLAERLQDGSDRRGALGGQVATDHAGAAKRQAEFQVAVAEIEVVACAAASRSCRSPSAVSTSPMAEGSIVAARGEWRPRHAAREITRRQPRI
jgi:hypothetical protein